MEEWFIPYWLVQLVVDIAAFIFWFSFFAAFIGINIWLMARSAEKPKKKIKNKGE